MQKTLDKKNPRRWFDALMDCGAMPELEQTIRDTRLGTILADVQGEGFTEVQNGTYAILTTA